MQETGSINNKRPQKNPDTTKQEERGIYYFLVDKDLSSNHGRWGKKRLAMSIWKST